MAKAQREITRPVEEDMDMLDQAKLSIGADFGNLPEGTQLSGQLCPYCNGGAGRERTLSVKATHSHITYTCHRSSCGKRGAILRGTLQGKISSEIYCSEKEENKRPVRLVKLNDKVMKFLQDTYGLSEKDIVRAGICWNETDSRLAIPIRDAYRTTVGWNYRKLDKFQQGPKSRIEMLASHHDAVIMAWYPMMMAVTAKIPVILVEDQLSAIKAAAYMDAAALLGTNLSLSKVNHLLKLGVRDIIVALDRDASGQAAKLVQTFRPLFNKMRFLPLERDIKDMTAHEISKLLEPLF